jgi:RNA polymerase sigma-70 factor, ECF subfamily
MISEESLLDELAARAARGDREAFEGIYNATVDPLFRFLLGQACDTDLAEDLAANTYLKAWTAAKSYRPGTGRYRPWLFTIARNELRDHWRRTRHTQQLPIEDAAAEPEAEQPQADVRGPAAVAALRLLNEEQLQIVTLRVFSELSHAEIARILGKREGAVRAQLLRALRRMRKVMVDAAT